MPNTLDTPSSLGPQTPLISQTIDFCRETGYVLLIAQVYSTFE